MRLRAFAAAASLAVLLPGLATTSAHAAAPAQRAAKVTLKDLPASSEVGKKVTLAGTAKPARKGKRVKVTVERLYAGGTWQKIATARTSKKGKYAVKVALTRGGTTAFRVKRAGGGTTAADSLAVYQWLDLVDQPQILGGSTIQVRRTSKIGSATFPKSVEWTSSGFAGVIAKPNGLCTDFEMWTGILASDVPSAPEAAKVTANVVGFNPQDSAPASVDTTTPIGPARKVALSIVGKRYTMVQLQLVDGSDELRVAGSPRFRCNASSLAPIVFGEVPL